MQINFHMLLAEGFLWALLLGAFGARKWLAVILSVTAVSAMYVGRSGLELFERGSTEAYITLGVLAGMSVLMVLAVSLIGASVGGAAWKWASAQIQPEDEEIEMVDEAESQ
jgi:hypothetical protein